MIVTGFFGDSEFADRGYEARKLAVASWLAYRPKMLGVELVDLFADGLRERDQVVSRALTKAALDELEGQGIITQDIKGTRPMTTDDAQYYLNSTSEHDKQFWLTHPDVELTPRERALLGLLESGNSRTIPDLELSLPFEATEQGQAKSPGRTELCLGHLVAINKVASTPNGYQISSYLI